MATRRSVDLVAPVLRPSRSGNAFEESVERLLRLIKLGVVGVGERLPAERELAAQMGVSRQTLREAIAALRGAGFLDARRGRTGGTFVLARDGVHPLGPVRALDARTVEDVLAIRYALETGAAELAARRALEPGDVAILVRLQEQCCGAQPVDYRPADSRLHLTLAELSGSPSLAAAVAEARGRVNDLLDAIPLLPRNIAHSDQQHERIVAAVVRGDAARARTVMGEHLDGTAALLRAFLA